MTEIHISVESMLFVAGGAACTALFVGKVVLAAYDDFRKEWRKAKNG